MEMQILKSRISFIQILQPKKYSCVIIEVVLANNKVVNTKFGASWAFWLTFP